MGATAQHPKISVCIPVLNGADRLPDCLGSLRALDYPADRIEIVIADGGSTDNTREIAHAFGARVLDNPGKTVAAGRNVSFAAAEGAFIASTDDDCVVPKDWAMRAVTAFHEDGIAAVGGISKLPDQSAPWPEAANYIFRLASQGGHSVQADHLADGDVEDLPGCNVIYRAEAVRRNGAFDEALVTAEDVDYHLRLKLDGKRLRTAPGLFVWHHKRPTVRGLFKQLRRYAEGRVQLGRKWPGNVSRAHHLLGWSLPLMAIGLVLSPLSFLIVALLTAAGLSFVAHRAGLSMAAALLTPAAFMVIAAGWSIGYLKETFTPMKSAYGR
ncbi:MAG: glycosyltransferase [Pseudomonadota bacterium]